MAKNNPTFNLIPTFVKHKNHMNTILNNTWWWNNLRQTS